MALELLLFKFLIISTTYFKETGYNQVLLFTLFDVALILLVLQGTDDCIFSPMPAKYAFIESAM